MLCKFFHGEDAVILQVTPNTYLRDVQEELCVAFHQRFPAYMAVLTVKESTFDMFDDLPFAALSEDRWGKCVCLYMCVCVRFL